MELAASIVLVVLCLAAVANGGGYVGSEPNVMVLQTTADFNYDDNGQLYTPPPNAGSSVGQHNFGLIIYPYITVVYCASKVYVMGGAWDLHYPTDIVQMLDPYSGNVSFVQPMDYERSYHSSVCIDGSIYTCGGYGMQLNVLTSCERYNTTSKQWHQIAPMPEAIAEHKAVALNGSMYIVGGSAGPLLLQYDVQADNWTRLADMQAARQNTFGAVALSQQPEQQILTCGDLDTWKRCELYDVVSDEWTEMNPMVYARMDFGMVVVQNRVLILGGSCKESSAYHCPDGRQNSYMTEVEEYNVSLNTSSLITPQLFSFGPSYASVVIA